LLDYLLKRLESRQYKSKNGSVARLQKLNEDVSPSKGLPGHFRHRHLALLLLIALRQLFKLPIAAREAAVQHLPKQRLDRMEGVAIPGHIFLLVHRVLDLEVRLLLAQLVD
jgi:hypothetical protein